METTAVTGRIIEQRSREKDISSEGIYPNEDMPNVEISSIFCITVTDITRPFKFKITCARYHRNHIVKLKSIPT